ncbi:MAG: class I SAM-dependent DNA methyltransferase [Candidatus Heimdallarchaeota archaeon]
MNQGSHDSRAEMASFWINAEEYVILRDIVSQITGNNKQKHPWKTQDGRKDLPEKASKILSRIPIDILGEILVRLLPDLERYSFGQHYTPSDIVDLILGFTVKSPNVTVLDPSCGTGSFLVRTFYRLQYLDPQRLNQKIFAQIWGIERSKPASQLTCINLISRVPNLNKNTAQIMTADFFDVSTSKSSQLPTIDVVIGNPPYSRQELLDEEYKAKLNEVISGDYDISLNSRTGIYAHFLVHGASFIGGKNGNRLGYVMLRSFLDVSFGIELKRFLLRNFKLIAVIESLNEKWFTDAQMIPCILILETETRPSERDQHQASFIQIKSNLEDIFPSIDQNKVEDQKRRWHLIDEFVRAVENSKRNASQNRDSVHFGRVNIEEIETMRILSINQKELLPEEKWGKFLTAPRSFYQILESSITKEIIVNLGDIATITTGLKSGSNEFFYFPNINFDIKELNAEKMIIQGKKGLRSRSFEIESEFVSPILWKFKAQSEIRIITNDGYCLTVTKSKDELKEENKKVLKYIEFGEEYPPNKPYSTRPTCQNRRTKSGKEWYNIDYSIAAPLLHFEIQTNREITFHYHPDRKDSFLNKCFMSNYGFYNILPKNSDDTLIILGILNSTFGIMMIEFGGRYIENRDGTISNQTRVYELKSIPVLNPNKIPLESKNQIRRILQRMSTRKIQPIWDEMQQPDRLMLDKIILEEILGLTKEEHEVLRSVLANIARSRNVRKKP